MGGFLAVFIHFGDFHLMAFGTGAGRHRIHLPHNIPQLLYLGVIQRGHLRPILRAGNLCGKYSENIFPVDGEHSVVGGDLLPVMGIGILYFLNVRQIFPIEGRHRLCYACAGSGGIRTKKQAEAGTDNQGD